MMVAALVVGVAMVALGLPILRDSDHLNRIVARAYVQQLRTKPLSHPERLPVVIMGTSLLDYAIQPDEQFAKSAIDSGLSPVRLVRLNIFGRIESLDEALLLALAELKPAVLVVQDHALFYAVPQGGYVPYSKFCKDRLLDLLRNQNASAFSYNRLVTDAHHLMADHRRNVSDHEIAVIRNGRQQYISFGPRLDVLKAMERVRQAGGKVYITSIPCDPRYQTVAEVGQAQVRPHIDGLIAAGIARELVCPLEFSGEDYLDLRHMSKSGRDRFTRWLLSELAHEENP
jgi:hypothetical protein